MSEIKEEIVSSGKNIKIEWNKVLDLDRNHQLESQQLIDFKEKVLLPNIDRITDISTVIIEKDRKDYYESVIKYFSDLIEISTYYQRMKLGIHFNFAKDEVLSVLLPAFEATIRLYVLGAIAVKEERFGFISEAVDRQVLSLIRNDGLRLYKSILYYPWYESRYGDITLDWHFNKAVKRIKNDNLIMNRYFSPQGTEYLEKLCIFDFLIDLRLEIVGQNDMGSFRYYPNYARYSQHYVDDIIQKIKNNDNGIPVSFKMNNDNLRLFLRKIIKYTGESPLHFYWSKHDLQPYLVEFLGL